MNIFDRINPIIKNTIFFNVQSVTEYGDIKDFEKEEPEKYQTWLRMAKKRYKEEFARIDDDGNRAYRIKNDLYLEKACFIPEFSKIVAITYAMLKTDDNGKLVRDLEKIVGETEFELLNEFCTMLDVAYSATHSAKQAMYNLCGHNIISHDIPLLTKRIVKHRDSFEDKTHKIPQLLKHYLNAKPWDSNVIDTINVWKFNGSDYISLNLIAEHMGLKKTVRLMEKGEINKLYWTGIEDDEGSTMKEIELQSKNFTNVALQLVNTLRQL
jgi:hypothetical protein